MPNQLVDSPRQQEPVARQQAISELQSGISRGQDALDIFVELAECFVKHGEHAIGRRAYLEVLRRIERGEGAVDLKLQVLYGLAQAEEDLGSVSEAVQRLEQLLLIRRDYLDGRQRLDRLLSLQRQPARKSAPGAPAVCSGGVMSRMKALNAGSNNGTSCARQLIDAYQQSGTSVLGLRPTPEDEIGAFGVATGVWTDPSRRLTITEFAEKPTPDYAREHLRVTYLPEGEYLTVFGQYVIKPLIFDYLEEHIRNNVRERGEFQLTSALDRLRQEDGFHGLIVDGRRFDIGLPEHYLETLRTFRET